MKLDLISDILMGAQMAALRRGGSMIDLSDVCVAIVEIPSVYDALTGAGLAAPDMSEHSSSTTDMLRLEAEAPNNGELRQTAALLKTIESLPDRTTRAMALIRLFDAALEARGPLTGRSATVVKDALRALDSGRTE
ncbi:MAG: hypothetical protein HYX50_00700 [Chloroflexi bacterium]|nr:hypothetical protein [Chloroflexota bacterium]